MASLISDINQSWEGKTGLQVHNAIKNQFNANIAEINGAIKNIAFDKYLDENNNEVPGKVKYTITKVDDTSTSSVFSLVAASNDKVYLEDVTGPEYVSPGSDVPIRFGFYITQNEEQVASKRADVTITIVNGGYTKVLDTFKSDLSKRVSTTWQTYNVPGRYLKDGTNEIRINLTFTSSEGQTGMTPLNNTSVTVKCYDLQLVTSIVGLNLYQVVSNPNDQHFTLNLAHRTAAGNALPPNTTVSTKIFNSSGALVNSVENNASLTLGTICGTPGNNIYTFFVQSRVDYPDATVFSNVVKYQFVGGDISSVTQTKYAYCIPNFSNYEGDTIQQANRFRADQYSTIELQVYAYTTAVKDFTYSVNGEVVTTISGVPASEEGFLNLIAGSGDSWRYQITQPDTNIISITDGVAGQTFTVETNNVTNDLVLPTNPKVRLAANGKTGKDEIWGTQTVNGQEVSLTKFTNFNWSSNGWIDNALLVNNNAVAVMDITPCSKVIGNLDNSTTCTGRAVTFRFKTTNENTEEELISCYASGKDGFRIFPQKAVIYKGTQQITTQFSSEVSDKEVTFVWYNTQYGNASIIYINGTSQAVLTTGTSVSNPAKITITANQTSLYLYNVETYEKSLTFNEVQALACLHKATNVSEYIKDNAIFNDTVTLGNNGQKVTIENLPVGSRYLLIKAHPLGPDRPWECINNLSATKQVGPSTTETKSWRLLAGNTYLITKTADGSGDPYNFFADRITLSGQGTSSMSYAIKNFRIYFAKGITKASKTGNEPGFGACYDFEDDGTYNGGSPKHWTEGDFGKTTLFKQGSAVVDTDYVPSESDAIVYKMRSDSIPANVFCLKCDYAESSGTHNTGFARLANIALEDSADITGGAETKELPMNAQAYKASYPYTCRSTIDGFPIYLFFADQQGNITYHGKYNFNNEKASPEVFGFQPYCSKLKYASYIKWQEDSGNLKGKATGVSYFSNEIVKNEANVLKGLFNLSDDSYERGHMVYQIEENGSPQVYVNPMECWEFSTNDAGDIEHRSILGPYISQIGAFTFPYTAENGLPVNNSYPYYGKTQYANLNPFTEKCITNGEDIGYAWYNTEQAWESRFPDDEDIEAYYAGGATPYLLRSLYKWVHKHNVYCWEAHRRSDVIMDFAANLHKYFNINYLLKYYMLTKLFINADQRIKNCMLAFYCDPGATLNADSDCPMGHMRAYYIFYDNDTILGVTNTGALENPWNADEKFGVFQGIDENDVSFHGLWGNLEYCYNLYITNNYPSEEVAELGRMMESAYKSVRNALSDGTISSYFDGITINENSPSDAIYLKALPDSASNVDLEVKYLYPSAIAPNAINWNPSSINQYQGNRKYHREWLLSKRTKWFDARYGAGTVNDYTINFKPAATSGTFQGSTLKFYSAFDDWKFYWQEGDSGLLTPTALLKKYSFTEQTEGNYGVLTCATTKNSNTYKIKGLYGANKIDLSGWYGTDSSNYLGFINSSQGGDIHLPLPYLREFIIGNLDHNFYFAASELQSLFVLDGTVLMPNLERLVIQNVTANTNDYFDLDLSQLTKLTEVDTTSTLCNIILPNGSALERLSVYKPISLVFENKLSLTSLTIQDDTSISDVVVRHSSSYLYKWAFDFALAHHAADTTVVLGSGTEKDELTEAAVNSLVSLARAINNGTISGDNVHISGIAHYAGITSEQNSILFNAFGSGLVISSTSSDSFSLDLNAGNQLMEGGTLNITPSMSVDYVSDNLTYVKELVSGDAVAFESIEFDAASSPYLCILKANRINDNTSRSCIIRVKAQHNGVEAVSDNITVNYIAIGTVTLSMPNVTNNIVNGPTTVMINLSDGSTKSHLLGLYPNDNITLSASSGTVQVPTGGSLEDGFTFTPASGTDSVITVTIFGKTARLNAFYDIQVCTFTSGATSDPGMLWLNDFFNGFFYNFNNNRIMRSDLSNLTVVTNGTTITVTGQLGQSTITNSIVADENKEHNLDAIAFFKSETTFKIPSGIKFTSLAIPEGVESIEWSSVYPLYGNYGTIKFPSTTRKAYLGLNLDVVPANLQFDLSNCPLLTKIYNAGVNGVSAMGNLEGVIHLNITVPATASMQKDKVLFKYTNTSPGSQCYITQIGNYSEESGSTISVPAAMFNLATNEQGMGTQLPPIYNFGSPTPPAGIKIGFIASYTMNAAALDWSTVQSYTKGLYYTFYKGSGSPTTLNLSVIERVGDATFLDNNVVNTLYVGENIKSVGLEAFAAFPRSIQTSPSDSSLKLTNATNIANRGFNILENVHVITIGSASRPITINTIGSRAFNTNTGVGHTINIYTDDVIANLGAEFPFGSGKAQTINLTTSVGGDHYADVIAQFRSLANNVNIYVNGSSTALQPLN